MSSRPGTSQPVFVDPSGRRGRTVQRVTWTLGALVGAYAVLVLVALVVPVGMNRLTLPGLGPLLPGPVAPVFADEAGDPVPPASSPSTPAVTATPSPSAVARDAASAAPTPTPPSLVPSAEPDPAPSVAATQAAVPGSSDTAPGRTGEKPGNAPTTHPEPASTHAATPHPRPTKG
ncbi:MAG: hypothetical protein ABWY33_04495 [Cellulomonas sp.]